jgi:glycosyltransferase involved in cell wall biosynthesis
VTALRILHVLTQRPDSTGSGVTLLAFLDEARRRGFSSRVVVGIPADEAQRCRGFLPVPCHPLRFDGPDVAGAIVGMSDVMPYRSRRFCDLSTKDLRHYERALLVRVSQAVAAHRPHLIHLNHLWIGAAAVADAFPTIPLLASCHGSDLRQFRSCPDLAARVRRSLVRLDAVAALTEAQVSEIRSLYGFASQAVTVVGAGFDDRLFRPGPKKVPPPVEIFYAGKLSRAKGVPWLLEALTEIRDLPWRIHLVGEGSGSEGRLCRDLGRNLGDRALLHGALPQREMARLMGMVHLFVLPSLFEGLPLVLLQALASGCRALVTDLPGLPPDLVAEAGPALKRVPLPPLAAVDRIRPEGEGPFRESLVRALRESVKLCLGGGPQQEIGVLRNYTWSAVFGRIEALYRTILSRRRRPFPVQTL